MTYYFKTETLLLSKFNIANKLNLKPEHVKFVDPRPADTEDITMSKVYNTAIDVVMQPGAPYNGVMTIFYNRVNLRTEFGNAKLDGTNYIAITNENSIHEAIDAINCKLGTHFTVDDIDDEAITPNKMLSSVRIQTKSASMEYVGSVDVKLYRTTAKKITIDHSPSCIWHYEQERKKESASATTLGFLNDTYNFDYTPARGLLESFAVVDSIPVWPLGIWGVDAGNAFLHFMGSPALILNRVDNLGWTINKPVTTGISLNGAVCIYRGSTAECAIKPYAVISKYLGGMAKPDGFDIEIPAANKNYRNVAVLLLNNPTAKTNTYKCLALLHYN